MDAEIGSFSMCSYDLLPMYRPSLRALKYPLTVDLKRRPFSGVSSRYAWGVSERFFTLLTYCPSAWSAIGLRVLPPSPNGSRFMLPSSLYGTPRGAVLIIRFQMRLERRSLFEYMA